MAKSKCANILPSIPLLADGALSAAESDSIEKHLSVCPACRREFDLYRAMKQTTASLSAPRLSIGFHENLMKTIGEVTPSQETAAPKRARVLRPSFLRHTMGYAATAVAAVAVVALSVVTLSQVSFLNIPKATPSDNLDDFVTQSQVTQPQVAESQGAQPKMTESQVTQSPTGAPIPSSDTSTNESPATPHRDAPAQVTESQVTQPQGTTPAASCGIVTEGVTQSQATQQKFATYRVFIEKAYLPEAEALLAGCPLDERGYRIVTPSQENGAAPMLEALSALPGYRTECMENDAAQPLTADYICLIGE